MGTRKRIFNLINMKKIDLIINKLCAATFILLLSLQYYGVMLLTANQLFVPVLIAGFVNVLLVMFIFLMDIIKGIRWVKRKVKNLIKSKRIM